MNFSGNVWRNATQLSPSTAQTPTRGHHKHQTSYLMAWLVLALVSLPENIFMCIVHLARRNTGRLQNAIFINHCIANILQATCVVMLSLQLVSEHVKLIEFHLGLFYSASVLSLPVMCVWRFIKTFYADYFQHRPFCNWVTLSLVAVWLPSLGVALPPLFGWGALPLSLTLPSTSRTSHAVFSLLVLELIPLLVMCVCNYKLFVRINGFRFRPRVGNVPSMIRGQESTAKWMLSHQAVALAVCCMPVAVEFIIVSFLPAERIPPQAHFTVNSLALAHSLVAPVLYAISDKQLWREMRSSFARKDRTSLERVRKYGGTNKDESYSSCTVGRWESSQNYEKSGQRISGNDSCITLEGHCQQEDRDKGGKNSSKIARTTSTQNKRAKTARVNFKSADAMSHKEYRRYIATPSPKRMRSIQSALQSSAELTSSVASISSNGFYLQQYKVPHFTNNSDPLRSAGFRQVAAGKTKLERSLSLSAGRVMMSGVAKRFLEGRNSTEGDYAMQRSCQTARTATTGTAAVPSSS